MTDGPRVGVIGAGRMGAKHAAVWTAEHVPVTLFDLVANRAESIAASTGAGSAGSLAELIDSVDIIDVCTPTYAHLDICSAAAAAGRHVICEAPIALTAREAAQIIETCEAAGVRLFVAQSVRYVGEYAAARDVVRTGRIGEPAVLRFRRATFRPIEPVGHWLFDERRSGGMVLEMMTHDMDFARWVAGDVVSVHCRSASRPGVDIDHAYAILVHESGAITHLTGSWAYPQPAYRTSLEIAGSHGLVEYDSERAQPILNFLHAGSYSGPSAVGLPTSLMREDPLRDELLDFLGAIHRGVEARVSTLDGLEAVRMGQAAIISARTGRAVATAEISS